MKITNYDKDGNQIDLSTVTVSKEAIPEVYEIIERMREART